MSAKRPIGSIGRVGAGPAEIKNNQISCVIPPPEPGEIQRLMNAINGSKSLLIVAVDGLEERLGPVLSEGAPYGTPEDGPLAETSLGRDLQGTSLFIAAITDRIKALTQRVKL